jgi:hypothetical protein
MTRYARLSLVAFVSALATGCITASTSIKIKPDGSGTIEQSVAMKAEAAEQFAAMAAGFGGAAGKEGGAKAAPPELFTEKQMQEAASKYGEGVTFVSSKPIKTKDFVGRTATYAFTDITKVHINQKPPAPKDGMAPSSKSADDVAFKFAKQPGGSSVLTVVFPEPDLSKKKPADAAAKKEGAAKDQKMDPKQLEMAKTMLDGLHISIDLDVAPGHIVKTNSPYVEGSKVTLLEMDFSQLISNDKLLSEVAEPSSIEEAKKLLQGVKGFKVNLDREVSVEFK